MQTHKMSGMYVPMFVFVNVWYICINYSYVLKETFAGENSDTQDDISPMYLCMYVCVGMLYVYVCLSVFAVTLLVVEEAE
jgi:hypothetical protein